MCLCVKCCFDIPFTDSIQLLPKTSLVFVQICFLVFSTVSQSIPCELLYIITCTVIILFLCVICTVTTEKPVQASLYQVKKAEKEREGFKKKMSWPLRQLKQFDAKYINKVSKI